MALILSNSDNTFEGATVFLGEKKLQVYKVNKKSMYVGVKPYKDVMAIKETLPKGYTFKKLMERVEGGMVKFGAYKVSEEEAARKESFDKLKTITKNVKKPMTKKGEDLVKVLFNKRFLKDSGSYAHVNEVDNHRIIVVKFDKAAWAVVNVDGTQYIFDLRYNVYTPFNKEIHKDGVNVLWPERDYEVKVKTAV
jgi:hypothetical protein